MRRWWLLAGLALLAWAAAAPAQEGELQGYVRDDLQLISQQSLPSWTERWTGPIEAATVLAWFAEHGYGRFIRDYNGDGIIDEKDTIQLADELGRLLMATETARGTTDVRLVLGLAQYVAGSYPDEFVLKIYDVGFPSEVAAEGLGTFSPTMVPGILLDMKTDPAIPAYEVEMETAEGVILGLRSGPRESNTYLAGRSFLYKDTPEGYTPIDLASSEEDLWLAGSQGQVLETLGRMAADRFELNYHGQWTPVEFMLALSPQHEPAVGSQPHPCPENALAYDVTETPTPFGRVSIAECVTRDLVAGAPSLDTYTYSVTNVDFLAGGCGICLFFVPNPFGFTTASMTGPPFWMTHAGWGGWWWKAPLGSCGIQPGATEVFSFTIFGPSTDGPVTGAVSPCPDYMQTISRGIPRLVAARTTGPGEYVPEDGDEPGKDCPDLTLKIKSATCTMPPTGGPYTVEVTAIVANIGTASAGGIFVRFESSSGNDTDIIGSLDPGETAEVDFSLTLSPNQPPDCPLEFTITVDPYHSIDECDEYNNQVDGAVACPGCRI